MRRPLVLVLLAAAAIGLLAACDKPVPQITLQSGATSTTVPPQTYCFDLAHCRVSVKDNVGALHARAGGSILVDVPRDLADRDWSAVSARIVNGAVHPLKGSGLSSGNRHNSHTARLVVPYGAGSSYFVVVFTEAGGRQTGTWVSRITITS